jgi:CDP-glycerol glycerophosphotransferase
MLKQCLCLLVYYVSVIAIRSRTKAVFGCYKNKFSDNSKYLYLHWRETMSIRAIWISGDKTLVTRLQSQGKEAYHRWSLLGIYHCLTSYYYVYSAYVGDINQWLCKGAYKVNLWHGSPLKEIEYDISNGPLALDYQRPLSIKRKLINHQIYIQPDLMLAPSKLVGSLFMSAFNIAEDALIYCGNPRTDYYAKYPIMPNKNLADSLSVLMQQAGKVILYAPTWRDEETDGTLFSEYIRLPELNAYLKRTNSILLLRFHPNQVSNNPNLEQFDRIIDISDRDDVYDILPHLDLMISDYSSLYIDALKFDIPILFYTYDEPFYLKQCRKTYAYADKLRPVGLKVRSFRALLDALESSECYAPTYFKQERAEQKQLYWKLGGNTSFEAIENKLGINCSSMSSSKKASQA